MSDALSIHVLGSGSKGNSLLLCAGATRVLIDAGFTEPELCRRLATAGFEPSQITGVIITHSHSDHFQRGIVRMCQRLRIPLLHCEEAERALRAQAPRLHTLKEGGLAVRFARGRPFEIGEIQVEAFDLPHDSNGGNVGLALRVRHNGAVHRVAVATDLGTFPADCLPHFVEAQTIVLESNHDEEMLLTSGRPATLIERILSDWGHLSNRQSAAGLRAILEHSRPGTVRTLLLAHLSQECNDGKLALAEARRALRGSGHQPALLLTAQDEPVDISL